MWKMRLIMEYVFSFIIIVKNQLLSDSREKVATLYSFSSCKCQNYWKVITLTITVGICKLCLLQYRFSHIECDERVNGPTFYPGPFPLLCRTNTALQRHRKAPLWWSGSPEWNSDTVRCVQHRIVLFNCSKVLWKQIILLSHIYQQEMLCPVFLYLNHKWVLIPNYI